MEFVLLIQSLTLQNAAYYKQVLWSKLTYYYLISIIPSDLTFWNTQTVTVFIQEKKEATVQRYFFVTSEFFFSLLG